MEPAKAAVLALGEESVNLTKNALSSLLLLTMFLAWAVLAGACNGAGQNAKLSGSTGTQEDTVQGQSDLVDEDTYRMGDEVEMNDDSGMRALSPEQRYAEDSEGRRIRGGAIDRSRANAITTAVEKASPAIVSITVTELQTGFAPTRDPFFSFFFE